MMPHFTSVAGNTNRHLLHSLWRFGLLALLLCTWLGNAQQSASAQHQATALSVFEPVVVDHCPGLSPYDAAALLQEPINEGEAISNLIFGPLHAALDAQVVGLQGFCGYTNATPVDSETIDRSQPHLLTNVPYPHAVAVAYFTPEQLRVSHTGQWPSARYDLLALTDVAGATNPAYDHQQTVQELSTTGSIPSFITWLTIATHVPYTRTSPFQEPFRSTASEVPVIKDETDDPLVVEPYEKLLWIWQPLTDGYFSVLVAKGYENQYQLVAARLGSQANEQDALGYSRVILKQLAAATTEDSTNRNTDTMVDTVTDTVVDTVTDTVTDTVADTVADTVTDTVVDTVAVVLDQPFTLTLGQTAEIADLDFRLTFRSASDDSGCASATDCSTMIFNGTLTFQKGEESDFAQAMAFIPEGGAFSTDFAGYLIYLTHIEKVTQGDFAATFFITVAPEPTPTVTATPSPTIPPPTPVATLQPTATLQSTKPTEPKLTGCPFLSTEEAAMILGTEVKAQEGDMRAGENLRCAYRSVDGTTAVLLATYGPFHPQRLLLDWVTLAAPSEERRVRQAQIALESGDPHQYLAAVQAIAKKLNNWSVVQTADDKMILYALRQTTVGGQQIYWAALHPTNLIAVEMLITLPTDNEEEALYDNLRQHSERVFAEAIAAYQATWPLVRDRLTDRDAATSAP